MWITPWMISADPAALPDRCRQWRVESGITQAEVGNAVGMGRAAICRFEHGGIKSPRALLGYVMLGMKIPPEDIARYTGERG